MGPSSEHDCAELSNAAAAPLTVIIPVYNESATVSALIQSVVAAPYQKQIIIVNDGSADGTDGLLRSWADSSSILVLSHPTNRGKSRAIRTGLEAAAGEFVLIQDADLEYDPADYPTVLEPLMRGEADLVLGSRYLRGKFPVGSCQLPVGKNGLSVVGGQSSVEGKSFDSSGCNEQRTTNNAPGICFRLGVSALNWAVRLLYGVRLTDEATCYKAMRTETLRRMDLQCEGFEFCPEVIAKACRMGLRIVEVPISYHPRTAKQGKKIRLRDGLAALRTLPLPPPRHPASRSSSCLSYWGSSRC